MCMCVACRPHELRDVQNSSTNVDCGRVCQAVLVLHNLTHVMNI